MNFCLAVIASEQSERGNPKSKNNAKFMDYHAVFTKTARNDKRKKRTNKAFKNFSVPKSASNEREREREKSPAQTLPHFLRAEFAVSPRFVLSANTAHFATLAKLNLSCSRALFCPQTPFCHNEFVVLALLCRFVVKLATPRRVVCCRIHYTLPRTTARQIFSPRARCKHRHAQRRCVKMTQSVYKSR